MQLIELFDRGAMIARDEPCFIEYATGEQLSFAEVSDITHRVGAALVRDGLTPGHKVAVLTPNAGISFAAILGASRVGAIWCALNARSTAPDLIELLQTMECDWLLYHHTMTDTAAAIAAAVSTVRGLVAIGGAGRDGDPVLSTWMAPEGTRAPEIEARADAICFMLGTGGTTGRSKAVQISHRNFMAMVQAFYAHMPEERPVQLMAAPMSHAAGGVALPVLGLGGTHIVHDGVHPAELLESIERHQVTRLFLPPTAIYALLAHPSIGEHSYASLKYFIYAAAPMSADKLREAIDVFGPVMTQTFGQAETPMIATCLSPADHADPALHTSCGRPSVVCRVEILDDDGNILGPGERGEICTRGDLVMAGYYENPEQTAAVQRAHGFHGTGDVGYKDERGYVYIVDRKRDMIISGGFNVFPSEVEQVLWGHPAVNDCAVIGLPDEKWGESVTAVVELKDGMTVDEAELIKLCRDRLGPVKTPKTVIFRTLPRSPVGKVLKRALRDEFWTGRDRAV